MSVVDRHRTWAAIGVMSSFVVGCSGPAPGEWVDYHLPSLALTSGVWAAGPERIWVLGVGGAYALYVIEDGEPRPVPEAQELIKSDPAFQLGAIWGTSDRDIWIHSLAHYDGTRWTRGVAPPPQGTAIWGADPQHYYLAAGDWLSVFDGQRWSAQERTLAGDLPLGGAVGTAIHGSAPNDIHAVFDQSKLLHFDGNEWRRQDSPTADAFYRGVWARSPSEAWAVGSRTIPGSGEAVGLVASWNGQSWKAEQAPDQAIFFHISGFDDGRVVAATQHAVYERLDGGSWSSVFQTAKGHFIKDIRCAGRALVVCEETSGSDEETIVWVRY